MRRVRPVRRAPSTRNWARRLPAPWTHPGPWVDLLVTDAHAPIIGVLEPQAGGDLPGTDPILQQVDDPLAQGRIGVQLADLGAGQPRPGRGLRRRGTVDPAPRRPRGGSRGTRSAGTGRSGGR